MQRLIFHDYSDVKHSFVTDEIIPDPNHSCQ